MSTIPAKTIERNCKNAGRRKVGARAVNHTCHREEVRCIDLGDGT
jgi:hypothetical protein